MAFHYELALHFLTAVFFLLIPADSMSDGDSIVTGHDLYKSLLLVYKISNAEEFSIVNNAACFVGRFMQSVYLIQDTFQNMTLPLHMSEKELIEFSKLMKNRCLNLPDEGVEINHAMSIYQKWDRDNPEKLYNTKRMCLFMSYVEAYGLEIPTKKLLK